MPVARRVLVGGKELTLKRPVGTPPSQVSGLTLETVGSTTIGLTYGPATGTAPISYVPIVSTDNGATWQVNGGTATGTAAGETGLTQLTAYRVGVRAINPIDHTDTLLPGTVTTLASASSSYHATLSQSSGPTGSILTYTVDPGSLGWPTGASISTTVVNGWSDQSSKTGTGTTPVAFTIMVSGGAGASCTVDSSVSPSMTNLDGTRTFSITASPTAGASRYDILVSDASGDTSTARNVSAVLNGVAGSTGTISLVATKSDGTTSSVGTVSLASGSATTSPASWTPPSAGEWTISGTNTAGLYNPWSPLYVCFAASGGTAQSISANSTYFLDQQPFQQDAWSGTPAGWTATNGATFGMGWGAFTVKVTPGGPSNALYGQLIDSDSGANATGGGTAISNVVQIHGTVSGGSEITINVNLPASDYTVYLDVATDSGMTNRTRIPLRFRITDVVAIESPSQEDMWLVSYPYNGPPGNLNWSNYTKTMIAGAQNTDFGITTGQWYRIDGITHYDNNVAWGNVASMEAGRRFLSRKGHGCAVVGVAQVGQPVDSFILADGSPCSSFVAAAALCNNKFRYLRVDVLNGWGSHYTSESYAEYQTVFGAHATKMLSTYRALAVIGFSTGTSGYYGQNGSSTLGYGRLNKIIESQIEATNPCVVSTDNCIDWNEFYGGHASWASQLRFVRSALLAMFMAEGSHAGGYAVPRSDRFATFATTGTLSGDTLYVPFTLPTGATNLIAKKWLNSTSAAGWTYSTPTAAELLSIVAVYAGSNTHWAGGTPILITGVTIDNTNKRLAIGIDRSAGAGMITYFNGGGTAAQPPAFTVQLFSDFYVYNKNESYGVGIYDDRIIDDWGFGPHARPKLDVVCT